MKILVYRPEITVYHRDFDGLWVSTHGTNTATLFYPMKDEHGSLTPTGFRRHVALGEEPFFTIIAPDGSYLGDGNRASLIARKGTPSYLYTPDGKVHDPINALVLAKRNEGGLALVRPDRPEPVPAPCQPESGPEPREWAEKPFGPSTWTDGPIPGQLAFGFFDDEPIEASRSKPKRKAVRS